jgi:uncharacterized membrane protein
MASEKSLKRVALAVYLLYLLTFLLSITGAATFLGLITSIVAVIIAYIKKNEASGWIRSHFEYQIKTFWVFFWVGLLGFVLVFFLVGFAVLFIDLLWLLYRTVKGLIALNDEREIEPTLII